MLNERDILADVIKDERFLNVNLAFCAVESSPQLKPTLVDMIREEQDLHTRLFQFAAFGRPQTGQAQAGWQQPMAGAWQQPGLQQPAGAAPWQQTQPYNTGMAAAGQYRPAGQQYAAGSQFGSQFGTQQAAGQVEIAGREYGPY